jgi:hypothetical protein
MTWEEIINDPTLQNLPFKIELSFTLQKALWKCGSSIKSVR